MKPLDSLSFRTSGWMILSAGLLARFFASFLDIQATFPTPQEFLTPQSNYGALGYSWFLQGGQLLYGFSQPVVSEEMLVHWAVWMQTLLGIASAFLVANLSFQLFQNQNLARWTGLGLAVLPNLLFMEHVIHPTSLYFFMLLLFCQWVLTGWEQQSLHKRILGVLLGAYLMLLYPLNTLFSGFSSSLFLSYQTFFLDGLPGDPESFVWGILAFFSLLGVGMAMGSPDTDLRLKTKRLGFILLPLLLISPLFATGTGNFWNRMPYEGILLIFAAYGLDRFRAAYKMYQQST